MRTHLQRCRPRSRPGCPWARERYTTGTSPRSLSRTCVRPKYEWSRLPSLEVSQNHECITHHMDAVAPLPTLLSPRGCARSAAKPLLINAVTWIGKQTTPDRFGRTPSLPWSYSGEDKPILPMFLRFKHNRNNQYVPLYLTKLGAPITTNLRHATPVTS